jgi:hypothetical protein
MCKVSNEIVYVIRDLAQMKAVPMAPRVLSRPVAGVLGAESAVLGVYVRLKREERRSGELVRLDTGCATLGLSHVTMTSQQVLIQHSRYFAPSRNSPVY